LAIFGRAHKSTTQHSLSHCPSSSSPNTTKQHHFVVSCSQAAPSTTMDDESSFDFYGFHDRTVHWREARDAHGRTAFAIQETEGVEAAFIFAA
jgi:hypothetical protein